MKSQAKLYACLKRYVFNLDLKTVTFRLAGTVFSKEVCSREMAQSERRDHHQRSYDTF